MTDTARTLELVPNERLPNVLSPITPMAMLSHAVEQGAGIEVMEKLMALQERYEATQAKKAFYTALAAAKSEIGPIVKNKTVSYEGKGGGQGTSYRHETFDAVTRAVDPILSKHGLFCHFETTNAPNEPITVTCVISHEGGHEIRNVLRGPPDSSGSKNGIQAIGSTLSYLARYTLKAALGLAAAEDDDGRAASEGTTITDEQADTIRSLLTESKANAAKFLEYLGAESVSDIPATKYETAVAKLRTKIARAEPQS